MSGILVDSNVILDLFLDDPNWAAWSEQTLDHYSRLGKLYVNTIIYTEVSIGFRRIEDLDRALGQAGFENLAIPKEALFLAGKAFIRYRRQKGHKASPLPDFYIGAQAAVLGLDLATRDKGRFTTYFPTVQLVTP
jgi:hypothetical protein